MEHKKFEPDRQLRQGKIQKREFVLKRIREREREREREIEMGSKRNELRNKKKFKRAIES